MVAGDRGNHGVPIDYSHAALGRRDGRCAFNGRRDCTHEYLSGAVLGDVSCLGATVYACADFRDSFLRPEPDWAGDGAADRWAFE